MISKAKTIAECPSCGVDILFEMQLKLGQFIDCPSCDEFLEVIDLDPVLLDWPIEGGDYDDDFDDDDW